MTIDDFLNFPANKVCEYKKLGQWQGYDVYEEIAPLPPGHDGTTLLYTSGPHFILDKDGEARRADMEEAWHIDKAFPEEAEV